MSSGVRFGESEGLTWRVAERVPRGPLRGFLDRLTAYEEHSDRPMERFELPSPKVVVILELGPPLDVDGLETTGGRRSGSFLAGLRDTPVRTSHFGTQRGIQLNLKPTTARRLWGGVGAELTGRILSLADLTGASWSADAPEALDWGPRLALVERWLEGMLARTEPIDPRMLWAESRILDSQGRLRVRGLSQELHMSERAFTRRFESCVGMTPKRYARLARFEWIKALLSQGLERPLADVAQEAGCFDQAHLVREVRKFSLSTPRTLRMAL